MKPLTAAFALLMPASGPAQTHATDVQARLAAIVGDWTIAGQESTYRETCDWYDKRAFVVCNTTDSSDGSRSQSVLGYSKDDHKFTYLNYGNSGSSRTEVGFPLGERGIVYTDERMSKGKLARITTMVEPQADGRVRFTQDRSTEGGPWERVAEFHYIKRK